MSMKFSKVLRETAVDLKDQLKPSAESPEETVRRKEALSHVVPAENRTVPAKGLTAVSQPVRSVKAPFTTSVIAADATLHGNFSCDGDLEILGNIKGSVTAGGSVRISGKVIGDIKASQLSMTTGGVQGNLLVDNLVCLEDESVVIGNISCGELVLGGRVRGNITVEGSVCLRASSLIYGDVVASDVSVEAGAHMKGHVAITSLQDSPEDAGLDGVEL